MNRRAFVIWRQRATGVWAGWFVGGAAGRGRRQTNRAWKKESRRAMGIYKQTTTAAGMVQALRAKLGGMAAWRRRRRRRHGVSSARTPGRVAALGKTSGLHLLYTTMHRHSLHTALPHLPPYLPRALYVLSAMPTICVWPAGARMRAFSPCTNYPNSPSPSLSCPFSIYRIPPLPLLLLLCSLL